LAAGSSFQRPNNGRRAVLAGHPQLVQEIKERLAGLRASGQAVNIIIEAEERQQAAAVGAVEFNDPYMGWDEDDIPLMELVRRQVAVPRGQVLPL